jgi:hypothetical protein
MVCKNRGGAKLISLTGIFFAAFRPLATHDHTTMLPAKIKRPEKHRLRDGMNRNVRNRGKTKTIFSGSQAP